jgi:arylsulfatase A-like enzyme
MSANRRQFLRAAAALAVPQARRRPPNIIFILADDLGYGDLSCYGQQRFRTPHLDRMAAEGMRFTQAYAGSTVCAPSRCSLLTGFHQGHAWVRGNLAQPGGGQLPLRAEDVTVAAVLKAAGYATGAFGKWGLGIEGTTGHPNRHGFDEWFGYLDQSKAHYYYTDHLFRNSERVPLEKTAYSHDLIAEEALGFVRRHRRRPFFLYLAFTIPHASLEVPDEARQPFLGQFEETPFPGAHYTAQPTPRAAFAGMVTRMDRDVGRLFALLREMGIDRDTVVFFSSDNGPHREGGHDPAYFRSSGGLRGIKRDLYEGGIRVPMIVRWPGRVKAGAVNHEPWAFWDFLPTAAAIAGAQAPAWIDGISVLPLLQRRPAPQRDYFYWEFHERGFHQAARAGNWKAVRLAAKSTELYDLSKDQGETNNLAAQNPEVVARMEQIMNTARSESRHWPVKG